MTTHTTSPRDTAEIAIYATGPTCRVICAPKIVDRRVVETELCRAEPRGSILKWKASPGPFADNGPNPRPCPHNFDRQHWLFIRESRR